MDKGRRRRTTTTISDLPEEALTEILVRLSVKDILPCVSVQKSWHSLIKAPIFITLHSNYHHQKKKKKSTNPHDRRKYHLLFCTDYSYEIRVDDIQCKKYLSLKYPPDLPDYFLYKLVSNGLICLFNCPTMSTAKMRGPHLWNPVIQKYKTLARLPHPPSSYRRSPWQALAFGFVREINDYVVVYIAKFGLEKEPHTHYVMTYVYSLSTDSWKKITLDHDSILPNIVCLSQDNNVFVNGVAIWAGTNSQKEKVLVCFDTKTEMLREILLPEWLESCSLNSPIIHAFDQSIAYFVEVDKHRFDNQLGMWVLKGDPMNEYSWEKKMMVTLDQDVILNVMGVRNNGEPILCNEYDLISYNLDSHKSYDFVESWDSWTPSFWPDNWDDDYCDDDCGTPFVITPFEESLGLLDVDCTQY